MTGKETMIQVVKSELTSYAAELSGETIQKVVEGIAEQLLILKAIASASFNASVTEAAAEVEQQEKKEQPEKMKEPQQTPVATNPAQPSEETETQPLSPERKYRETVAEDQSLVKGYFTQKLRGGLLHSRLQLYVPESSCRQLGLQQGDFLKAERTGFKKQRPLYDFTVVHHSGQSKKMREVVSLLTIKKNQELARLYIEVERGEDFPALLLLSDADIAKFHLVEGDIIDYAYEVNDIMTGCVIWRYPIETVPTAQSHDKAEAHASPPAAIKPPAKKSKRKCLPIFAGLHIVMVGGVNRNLQRSVKEEVLSRAGSFTFCSGDEKKTRLIAKIKKADIVVIYTQSVSHEAMYLVKDTCKLYDKLYTFTKNIGGKAFVQRISQLKKKLAVPASITEQESSR